MNTIPNAERAKVLIEALPYIRNYNGKILVVKYGGNAMINEELKKAVMGDIVLLRLIGVQVVLVHGGGPEISETLTALGKKSEFIDGLRVTDAETVGVVQMVLAGQVNKSLVSLIACRKDEVHGYVGEITEVNTAPITDLLEKGYIPVISTLATDAEGHSYNVNADTAAARIAGALGAESLISMTDIAGLLMDKDDPTSLIRALNVSEAPELISEGVISGGMIPKVDCCIDAIRRGVKKVFIIDGRIPHAILIEVLTDEGIGTMFVA